MICRPEILTLLMTVSTSSAKSTTPAAGKSTQICGIRTRFNYFQERGSDIYFVLNLQVSCRPLSMIVILEMDSLGQCLRAAQNQVKLCLCLEVGSSYGCLSQYQHYYTAFLNYGWII